MKDRVCRRASGQRERFPPTADSRDVIGRLKTYGVIDAGPRAPMPGAPVAWVTTKRFLEIFALENLRDLPDLETLEPGGLKKAEESDDIEAALDDALGMDAEEREEEEVEENEFDEPNVEP
jgi:segregation and condensation protein B